MNETWLAVVGCEGLYEVSDLGRVRSVDRYVSRSDGRRRFAPGRVLAPSPNSYYPSVVLSDSSGKRRTTPVHTIVTRAFLGPRPGGQQTCHGNGNARDNRLANLRYDTPSGNMLDAVRHGTHFEAAKTHCKHGHEFTPENIYRHPTSGQRVCRACTRKSAAA